MDASITIVTIAYIVILVVPGVFFKRFYFQGPFSQQFQSGQFADRFVTSLFWGMITQVITFYLFINTFDVDSKSIFELLTRTHGELNENKVPILELTDLTNFLYYFISSVAVAVILGHLCHKFVRITKLDIYTEVLRFSNKWHYYFSGEILKTREFQNNIPLTDKVEATLVDILVKYGDGDDRLFSGNLVQFTISQDGNLETIYLAGTRRYSNSRGENIPAKEIPGDCFIIPYENVLNMNIQYIISKDKEQKRKVKLQRWKFTLIQTSIFLYLTFVIFFPWFTSVNFFLKLLANLTLLLSWTTLAITLGNFLIPEKNFGRKGIIALVSFTLLFLIIGLWIVDLNVIQELMKAIKSFGSIT